MSGWAKSPVLDKDNIVTSSNTAQFLFDMSSQNFLHINVTTVLDNHKTS